MNLFKRATTRAALGVLAAGALALAAPAAAQAATITGAGTSVTFSGTGGDYITGDQTWSYDPSNSTINATVSPDGNHVSVGINGDTWWYLDFAAPQGQALTAGTTYDNAMRYPFQNPTGPGLSLDGDGRGCNTLTGSFTVNKAVFGPNGWIQSFDATFVQHCEGSTTSEATGEIDIENGPAPAQLGVTVTPAATASVDKSGGQATITGTVTCNENATACRALSTRGSPGARWRRVTGRSAASLARPPPLPGPRPSSRPATSHSQTGRLRSAAPTRQLTRSTRSPRVGRSPRTSSSRTTRLTPRASDSPAEVTSFPVR